MDIEFLEECGLTKGESKVYMALTALGSSKSGPIIKKAKMQRSAVYFCLQSLIGRGLASYITRNNIKYFEAENPEKLYRLIDKKIGRLENSKGKISSYIKELEKKRKDKEEEAKIFKGWQGMNTIFDDILKVLRKDDDLYVIGVITVEEVFPRFRRFIGNFNKKRLEIGFNFNVITNERHRNTLGADRKKEKGSNVRFLPEELQTPTVVYIYKNTVVLVIWKKEPVGFVIESESAADSFRNYFKVLWKIAKK